MLACSCPENPRGVERQLRQKVFRLDPRVVLPGNLFIDELSKRLSKRELAGTQLTAALFNAGFADDPLDVRSDVLDGDVQRPSANLLDEGRYRRDALLGYLELVDESNDRVRTWRREHWKSAVPHKCGPNRAIGAENVPHHSCQARKHLAPIGPGHAGFVLAERVQPSLRHLLACSQSAAATAGWAVLVHHGVVYVAVAILLIECRIAVCVQAAQLATFCAKALVQVGPTLRATDARRSIRKGARKLWLRSFAI